MQLIKRSVQVVMLAALCGLIAWASLPSTPVANAAQTGGFPSRPTFQAVGVGVAPSAAWTPKAAIDLPSNAGIWGTGNAADDVYFSSNLLYNGNWIYRTSGAGIVLGLVSGNQSGHMVMQTAPAGTAGATATITQWVIPKWSGAFITVTASTCVVTVNGQNFASCVHTATGEWTATFATAYANSPLCNENTFGGGFNETSFVIATSPSTVEVGRAVSGALTDGNTSFYINCWGP